MPDDVRPPMSQDMAPVLADTAAISSYPLALIAGGVAAIVSGLVWGGIAYATNYEIGWLAIGVGFLCGIAVRFMGKGEGPAFGAIGAAFSLGGVVLGKICTIMWMVSREMKIEISISQAFQALPQTFSAIDLLFYALALWQGWKIASAPRQ